MLALRSFLYLFLRLPIKLLVNSKIVPDNFIEYSLLSTDQPVFYVMRNQSASDILLLKSACAKLSLPDPLSLVTINNKKISRMIFLEKATPIFRWRTAGTTDAISQGLELLRLHTQDEKLNAQLIPAHLIWGRTPTKEQNNANITTILAEQSAPSWLRKFFIVLLLGRHTIIRFSDAISFRMMADRHGSTKASAQKLMRIARFHFYRQTIAATGPRLMNRQQMFATLFANPSIQRALKEEATNKNIAKEEVKRQALKIMTEIAGDYRDVMVRFGERILRKLWSRLYRDIKVNNAGTLRKLAEEGCEIIYVPCHRSHMDYLLLTYVIFQQGLVTPRIAAGINLNFWPAGPIFRKAGAFFIRRSFKGDRLYSTIFREYLSLLFERGYPVKYYTEGGRSRTGRLLSPKTGMFAMTIQSLLRGIDRPITLVPIYLGYEHVMEVGSYYKELSGSKKKNESILGVLKAIKSLRNYGKGYINIGKPINLNQFLSVQVPDWKQAINPLEPQNPSWLTPTVNVLANQVMTSINQCAAINGVALVALILHATEYKALSKRELINQVDFFLNIQRKLPYSELLTIPTENGQQLLDEVIVLNKVTINKDSLGDIVSLSESARLEMRYYRNNIIHTFIVPSLICRILKSHSKIGHQELLTQVTTIVQLLRNDLFLWQDEQVISQQVKLMVNVLKEKKLIKQSKAGFWSLSKNGLSTNCVHLMAECINECLQRLTIICSLVSRFSPLTKSALEDKVVALAKRLSVLNDINAPEFIDKNTQASLIYALIEQGFVVREEHGELVGSYKLDVFQSSMSPLIDVDILQSITRA